MRRSFVTLVTSDAYTIGVEALAYSLLRVHAAFPLLVLHTPQVSATAAARLARFFAALAPRLRVSLACVDDIPAPHAASAHVAGWVNSGYTKLRVFALAQFDQVVYIDADAVVLENVDEVR
ncbi:hypothetical protein PybrP1_010591 [[Pythium] brassicae (nom. inval.)]|nr:hypothetical protein PybrP1_010591 [[Pythium] brassicae (nom. inval.)]